jgi:DNA helicase-2/ATP-dependent DNA helicase PcrA
VVEGDVKMAKIARLVGGAGTGKTSELLGVMESARVALGGDPLAIGFASFTRAARAEAVARASAAWNVPPEALSRDGWFRTVHSTSYRMLGIQKGALIDESKASQKWVADALKVDVRVIMDDDSGYSLYAGDTTAAASLNCWEISRARIEPLAVTIKRMARTGQEPPSFAEAKQFIKRYENAKRLEERVDYSDLLARYAGLRFDPDGITETDPDGELPPGVKAWIFDEAQDASALVDKVCRRLASGPEVIWVYLAGDPMQSIFGFGGSDSRHFMGWPADKERTMPQSWRCPPPVMELGERCLKQMRSGYWDRGIAPASHGGEVRRAGGPSSVVPKLDPTVPTLIVARCNYVLDDWTDAMKKKSMPYAKLKSKDTTNVLRGIKALWDLEHGKGVDGDDFSCAVAELPTKGGTGPLMKRGAKAAWERDDMKRRFDRVYQNMLLDTGMTEILVERIKSGTWADLVTGGERWRSSAVKYGADLATHPQIRVGTIHAAKGMEAEVVVLPTTTSRRIAEGQDRDPEQHDEERRVEYVGVTRARKTLIVSSEPVDYRMELKL